MRRLAFLFLFAAGVLFAADTRLDPAAIEKTALAELAKTNTPGGAVALIQGDQIVFTHGYGVANVETGAAVTPDMLFRLGSTTKMLTASAVVSLALEGKLRLDEPVGRHIAGLHPRIAALTPDQLMSHTAGLKDEAVMFGRHDDRALGDEIHLWTEQMFFTKPGRIYSYSNPGFWLAGYLAECVAGEPYATVMDDRIFTPLGMARTTLRPVMAMTWPLAQGHDVIGGKTAVLRPAADNAANWPAGSVFSSVLDLARLSLRS